MSISDCQAQHEAMMRVAAHLNVQAERLEHSGEFEAAARTLQTLDAMMVDHVQTEDRALIPVLLAGCPQTVEITQASLAELEGLKGVWRQYVDFWNADRIAEQPGAFARTTRAMMGILRQRITHEQEALYARVPA